MARYALCGGTVVQTLWPMPQGQAASVFRHCDRNSTSYRRVSAWGMQALGHFQRRARPAAFKGLASADATVLDAAFAGALQTIRSFKSKMVFRGQQWQWPN